MPYDVTMLSACTSVRSEIEKVIYQHITFNIYAYAEKPIESRYKQRDDLALTRFRKVHLNMHIQQYHELSHDCFDDTSEFAAFLRYAGSILASRTDNSPIDLIIDFHDQPLQMSDELIKFCGPFWRFLDSSHKFLGISSRYFSKEIKSIWLRMKCRKMISHWQSELQIQAPNVKVATNAEQDGFEVLGKLVGASSVYFKIPGARVQGRIWINGKGDGLIHAVTPGWDGSDLDTYV